MGLYTPLLFWLVCIFSCPFGIFGKKSCPLGSGFIKRLQVWTSIKSTPLGLMHKIRRGCTLIVSRTYLWLHPRCTSALIHARMCLQILMYICIKLLKDKHFCFDFSFCYFSFLPFSSSDAQKILFQFFIGARYYSNYQLSRSHPIKVSLFLWYQEQFVWHQDIWFSKHFSFYIFLCIIHRCGENVHIVFLD